ncbi:4'-phosphopantetheinyl transferase superfamily protein [Streptomyces sp. H27-C3]|uniref:4'-phosphopantetheinyl transferase family protein n=1 Tax=Streptomyces sp. H27-C3 TaxID=3046305 RepID=UPI0024B8CD4A|nr:4'-phosphopantetheinyl transferase superfamily protein [Streptomyces sp. H27-C3]MDJ0462727.1 4'-phosphopantetheinyl transferase superfamily protein [Streptomyces sp. H27-C3]
MNRTARYAPVTPALDEPMKRLELPVNPGTPLLWALDAVRHGDAAERLAAAVLDAEEKRRAAAFRRETDRRCYITAHVGLRVLLGSCLGVRPADVPLRREPCMSCGGPHGRPVTRDGRIHFSLSHSGDLALLACAAVRVGVDIEAVPRPEHARELTGVLHPTEIAELAALPEAERPAGFARAWSRKESYLKGIGTGLARSLSLDHLGTGPVPLSHPVGWTIHDVDAPEGFVAAVAVRHDGGS